MNINLNLLKSFHAVYKVGGIIKAAGMLGMAPPTVTYNIKQLENQLGRKLFNTHRKGTDPTEDAKVLFPLVEAAFENLLKCNELLNADNRGILKIGTAAFIADYIIAKFLREFQKKYPNITLEFHHHPKHNYLTQLEENKIDIAIMQFLKRPGPQINIFELISTSMTFFTSKKFAVAHNIKNEITVERFLELPFICHAQSRTVLVKLENYFEQKLDAIETASVITAYGMVMDGQGVGIFFEEYLDDQKNDQIVKFKIKDKPPPPLAVHECAYHKKTPATVALFIRELKKFYSL